MVWCICGDFNVVKSVNERKGARESVNQTNEISVLTTSLKGMFCWIYQLLAIGINQMVQQRAN